MTEEEVAAAILAELQAQPEARSIDPADVARRLAAGSEDWRRHLAAVRRVALVLHAEGRAVVLRHGKPVDPAQPLKGVIRIARAP